MKNDFYDLQTAKDDGFEGFLTIGELINNQAPIPDEKGIYMVIRDSVKLPKFLLEGTGGFFKGKNPNVAISELKINWVVGADVLYIGKAGSSTEVSTLNSRLKLYLEFGQGKNRGHYGGRYIWQLEDSLGLLLCWKEMPDDDIEPADEESRLIAQFKAKYNKRPFANLKD